MSGKKPKRRRIRAKVQLTPLVPVCMACNDEKKVRVLVNPYDDDDEPGKAKIIDCPVCCSDSAPIILCDNNGRPYVVGKMVSTHMRACQKIWKQIGDLSRPLSNSDRVLLATKLKRLILERESRN